MPKSNERSAMDVIDTFTTVDDIARGTPALIQMTIDDIFTMGQFHEWAQQFVNDDSIEMEQMIEVRAEFLIFIDENTGF